MSNEVDESALTYESGPSDPVRLADGPGATTSIDIAASPAAIWPVISDINFAAAFSPEFQGAEWIEPDAAVGVGSQFIGTNHNDVYGEFKVPSFIDTYEPDVAFGWRTSDMDNPGARWRYDLEPTASGTHVTYTMILGPGPSGLTMAIESMPDKEDRILRGRIRGQYASMVDVLAGIKAAVEGA